MVLSIPLGELDFLGRTFQTAKKATTLLSIPLGELDFLGQDTGLFGLDAWDCFQFPLGN